VKGVGPQLFVAERVEAEDGLPVSTRPLAIDLVRSITIGSGSTPGLLRGRRLTESGDHVRQDKGECG